jgi:hypothetical protein
MAAFGMCIGSFAFHSQPTWITHKFDSLAMDQVFYVLHQANVRAMLPDSISDFTPYLPVLQLNGLCGDSGCFHEDARDAVRTFMDMFAAPVSEWDSKARAALPQSAPFEVSVVGLVMVIIRSIIHPETWGSAADEAYTVICAGMAGALMPPDQAEQVKSAFCATSSGFFQALQKPGLRVASDIGRRLAGLVEILQMFISSLYWQEEKVKPLDYTEPWLQSKLISGDASCWRQMHSTWHRSAAQMIRKLSKFVMVDGRQNTLAPPLTLEQKQAAWSDPTYVATYLMETRKILKVMSEAHTVEMCQILTLAKKGADKIGGEPLDALQHPLSTEFLNNVLSEKLSANDPYEIGQNVNGKFSLTCDYDFVATVKEVTGLACAGLHALDLTTTYGETTAHGASLTSALSFESRKIRIGAKASGSLDRDTSKWACIFPDKEWKFEVEASILFKVEAAVSLVTYVDGIFDSNRDAFSATLDRFELTCNELTIDKIDITNFWGESAIRSSLNGALSTPLLGFLCDKVETQVRNILEAGLEDQIERLQSFQVVDDRRRLSNESMCTYADDPDADGFFSADKSSGLDLIVMVAAIFAPLFQARASRLGP